MLPLIGLAILLGCVPKGSTPEASAPPSRTQSNVQSGNRDESVGRSDSAARREPMDAANAIHMLAWNIESDGADPEVIAEQLLAMPEYDLYGFSEVRPSGFTAIREALGDQYYTRYSKSGYDDRLAYAIRKDRFEIKSLHELERFGDLIINPGNYRSPYIAELVDKQTSTEFVVMLNHLARGKESIRQQQAKAIRLWAQSQPDTPIIAIGDYNFDYVFSSGQGNTAFDIFLLDDVFTWVKPEPLIDTNWYDRDGDGRDDYPGSLLDFVFTANAAKQWSSSSRVILRDGDFPDDERTSDHRPVEATLVP